MTLHELSTLKKGDKVSLLPSKVFDKDGAMRTNQNGTLVIKSKDYFKGVKTVFSVEGRTVILRHKGERGYYYDMLTIVERKL
jgi:hypothetical protein